MVGEHVWERPRVCEPTENQNPTVLSRREPSFLNTHSTLIKRRRGGGEGRDRAGEGRGRRRLLRRRQEEVEGREEGVVKRRGG